MVLTCPAFFVPGDLRDFAWTEGTRDGEILYSLKEARIVIEQWRKRYNTKRPHSALGYRPPAPAAYSPTPASLDQQPAMQ